MCREPVWFARICAFCKWVMIRIHRNVTKKLRRMRDWATTFFLTRVLWSLIKMCLIATKMSVAHCTADSTCLNAASTLRQLKTLDFFAARAVYPVQRNHTQILRG